MQQRLATELDRRFLWIPADVTRFLALTYDGSAAYIVADRHRKAAIHTQVSIKLILVVAAGGILSSSAVVVNKPSINGE